MTFQVFIEPKGEHLKGHDKWKEDFLKQIREEEKTSKLTQTIINNRCSFLQLCKTKTNLKNIGRHIKNIGRPLEVSHQIVVVKSL
jgi:hypothetical protein